ncbi:hypothetical protein [Streptomyces sp. NPDC020917]|uniref:hypothetical protein n=1 Tax=Streptomyces sp. NPDC020917 TaxID=3365102 RepID=UPI0037907878
MGRRHGQPPLVAGGRSFGPGTVRGTARARGLRGDRRWAIGCACAAFVLAQPAAWDSGEPGLAQTAFTCGIALVVLAVLWPAQVAAGEGWLVVRGPLRTRRVRTDALAGIWLVGDLASSLVLRDIHGGRAEVDAEAVVADPLLWHLLESGVHRSQERGTLRTGARVLTGLGRRVDGEARAILRASGLD